jgi:UDP-glucose 4-epimerase
MQTRTLLLTGAAGFLGRATAREFLERGWKIHGLDVAPSENAPRGVAYTQAMLPGPQLAEIILRTKPDACVHAAGRASVALSREQPEIDFQNGVVATFELLNTLRLHAPQCRTVLLSSAAVYGNPVSLPIDETHAPMPLSPYGFHKRICEVLGEEFATVYGSRVASARIFSAYGVGLRRQVVWDICEKVLLAGDDRVRLRGSGRESRDFIHAADVASALATLLEGAPLQGECYNLGAGEETTIAELAQLVLGFLGKPGLVEFGDADNPDDPKNWRADISKLQALGYRRRVSLEEGLRGVTTWAQAELGLPR